MNQLKFCPTQYSLITWITCDIHQQTSSTYNPNAAR